VVQRFSRRCCCSIVWPTWLG